MDGYLVGLDIQWCCWVASVVPDSVQPHRRQPTRLLCPWDSPGKNTGVGCHFLLQCMKVKVLSHVWLFVTPWTAAYQAPPSMGFSRWQYWSGVPLPSPKDTGVGWISCDKPNPIHLVFLGDERSDYTETTLRGHRRRPPVSQEERPQRKPDLPAPWTWTSGLQTVRK